MTRIRGVRGSRPGFTLAEIVVSAVILTVIAAIALPSYAGYNNAKRASDTATILNSLALSLNNYNNQAGPTGYLQTVGKYPQFLHHLTSAITTSDKQCSGAVYTTTQVSNWLKHAPYSGLDIVTSNGVSTPLGWVHDSVIKGTHTGAFGSSQSGWVELHIDSVSTTDVLSLDSLVDNGIDSTQGLIRDSTATNTLTSANLHLIRFLIPAPLNGSNSIGCF